ncbi:MAG: DUF58 domain-containing protein [Planctomycetes bacterium]|nr:DUF58 domain-containing protein [Planctomycetota bacterium]
MPNCLPALSIFMAKRLLDPKGLGLVGRMELVARQAVEGFLSGLHPSPYFGSSVEYADHRPYSVGDEIRTIDWKLLAKTDKYYVKLFEEETNTRCTLILDTSRSMSFAPSDGALDKLTYGMFMAAALAHLMLRQNDAVGLALFDHALREYLPARATPSHFRNMLNLMEKTTPGDDTDIAGVLHELAGRIPKRGIIILISDMLGDVDKLMDSLGHFKYQRHEVLVFHLMDPAERTFPYEKLTRFKDIEGAGSVIANPRTIRKAYLTRLNEFLDRLRRTCLERDISYELILTDQRYDKVLSAYLARRNRTM